MREITREEIFEAEFEERIERYKREGYDVEEKGFKEGVSRNILNTFNKVQAKWRA